MNTVSGRAIHSAATSLAMRSAVQGLTPAHCGQSFGHESLASVQEISQGYQVTKSDFGDALRSQQGQMAQDLRDAGMGQAADRVNDRLGIQVNRFERDR